MMHKTASHMEEYNRYFTPCFADGIMDFAVRVGWLDFTVLGGRHLCGTLRRDDPLGL